MKNIKKLNSLQEIPQAMASNEDEFLFDINGTSIYLDNKDQDADGKHGCHVTILYDEWGAIVSACFATASVIYEERELTDPEDYIGHNIETFRNNSITSIAKMDKTTGPITVPVTSTMNTIYIENNIPSICNWFPDSTVWGSLADAIIAGQDYIRCPIIHQIDWYTNCVGHVSRNNDVLSTIPSGAYIILDKSPFWTDSSLTYFAIDSIFSTYDSQDFAWMIEDSVSNRTQLSEGTSSELEIYNKYNTQYGTETGACRYVMDYVLSQFSEYTENQIQQELFPKYIVTANSTPNTTFYSNNIRKQFSNFYTFDATVLQSMMSNGVVHANLLGTYDDIVYSYSKLYEVIDTQNPTVLFGEHTWESYSYYRKQFLGDPTKAYIIIDDLTIMPFANSNSKQQSDWNYQYTFATTGIHRVAFALNEINGGQHSAPAGMFSCSADASDGGLCTQIREVYVDFDDTLYANSITSYRYYCFGNANITKLVIRNHALPLQSPMDQLGNPFDDYPIYVPQDTYSGWVNAFNNAKYDTTKALADNVIAY